jgi:hypothetical protein
VPIWIMSPWESFALWTRWPLTNVPLDEPRSMISIVSPVASVLDARVQPADRTMVEKQVQRRDPTDLDRVLTEWP